MGRSICRPFFSPPQQDRPAGSRQLVAAPHGPCDRQLAAPARQGLAPVFTTSELKIGSLLYTLCHCFLASEARDLLASKGRLKSLPLRENGRSGPLGEAICSSLHNHSQVTSDDARGPAR